MAYGIRSDMVDTYSAVLVMTLHKLKPGELCTAQSRYSTGHSGQLSLAIPS